MDYLCFSHLRWNFVFQRPNHLLSRAARRHRVFFVEEPIGDATTPWTAVSHRDGVEIVVPHIAAGPPDHEHEQLRSLLSELVTTRRISSPLLWYYTPMALPWTAHLRPQARAVVYDCMDNLAGFRGAPRGIVELERQLMDQADLVFAGGQSLFEARRHAHRSVHCFPSSVDVRHFQGARHELNEPADQAAIPHPRLGFFGVLDERVDWNLVKGLAERRPDWQLVLVGPVAKVDPKDLPTRGNIHYLGPKPYADLPAYLAGWEVALLPFAKNEATRFISPTKTPEYLAGGRPIASTSIHDVVEPYGNLGLVHLGDTLEEFASAIEAARAEDLDDLRRRADRFLAGRSWDRTWAQMEALIEAAIVARAFGGRSPLLSASPTRRPAMPIRPATRRGPAPVSARTGAMPTTPLPARTSASGAAPARTTATRAAPTRTAAAGPGPLDR